MSRRSIRSRVKDQRITFGRDQISSHGGLEILRLYLKAIEFGTRVRDAVRGLAVDRDYGALRFVLCVMGLLLVGGRRLSHLENLRDDALFRRFAGVRRVPSSRTVVRWMKSSSAELIHRVSRLLRELVYDAIAQCEFSRLTVDVDGTVLRTGVRVAGTARGFNPHHPKDKSYYPLTAMLAQTGQLLRVQNRAGNVHDSNGALAFLQELVGDLRTRFGQRILEVRLDGAFCQAEILRFLHEARIEFAVRLPLWQWLGIREQIAERKRWTRVRDGIYGFSTVLPIAQWQMRHRVVVYRKHVHHRTRKNFQMDLFSPDDGHYEYSAVITNRNTSVAALWYFMAGRGGHEKMLAELKQELAFDAIPTNQEHANHLWLQLCALSHNLVRLFQIDMGCPTRVNGWKRTCRFVFQSLHTLRFELIHQPVRLLRPGGRAEIRFAVSPPVRRRIERCQLRIAELA